MENKIYTESELMKFVETQAAKIHQLEGIVHNAIWTVCGLLFIVIVLSISLYYK